MHSRLPGCRGREAHGIEGRLFHCRTGPYVLQITILRIRCLLSLLPAALILAVPSAGAQVCSINGTFEAAVSCERVESICPMGKPVRLELAMAPVGLRGSSAQFAGVSRQTCVSSVVWKLPGGDVMVDPYAPYYVTLPSGRHVVEAEVRTGALAPPSVTRVPVYVGRAVVSLAGPDFEIDEGSVVRFAITRANTEVSTTVQWLITTQGTTPTADISPAAGSVTLAPGQTVQTVSIPTVNDSIVRGDRTYSVRLLSATNDYVVQDASAFTLRDDEMATIGFAAENSGTVQEGAGTAVLKVQRSRSLATAVSASYTTHVGVLQESGIVHFAPGQTVATIQVAIDDQQWTGRRLGTASLDGVSAGAAIWSSSTVFTIEDDEPAPVVTVSSLSLPERNSGRSAGAFTLKISPHLPRLVVPYSLEGGTAEAGVDYVDRGPGYVIFEPGATEATVPFEILGDTAVEAAETFALHLYASDLTLPDHAICTILNDDAALLPATVRVAKGRSQKFQIDAGLPVSSTLTLTPRVTNPSIVSLPANIRIEAGQSTATFNVTATSTGSARISFVFADRTLSSSVIVEDLTDTTPVITSIEPSSGSVAGGTAFLARGMLLTGDCTLLFGGIAAEPLVLTSEGMLAGTTPPHAIGTVAITLTCGPSTFVLPGAFTYHPASRTRSARH